MKTKLRNIFKEDKNRLYSSKMEVPMYYLYKFTKSFFGALIYKGGKLRAFNWVLALKSDIKDRELIDPIWPFITGCVNIIPEVMLLPRKLGGKVQGVPLYITERKQIGFVIKWTLGAYRKKHRTVKIYGISEMLTNAVYNRGEAIEQKLSVYDISSNNRHLIRKGPKWRRRAKFRRRRRRRKKRHLLKKKSSFRRLLKISKMSKKSKLRRVK